MPKKKRPSVPIITEDELRSIIASVAMECGPFTPDEIADLRRVQRGELTIEQSIAELNAKYQAGKPRKPAK